ncbi:MAG: DUF3267 domain-containing protein [Clostridia bacterium]|nr:DUF3267 domain-containing protein [Clostridia bacterium]
MKLKKDNFYYELPEGYVPVKTIDATKPKTAVIFTILSFVITIIALIPFAPISEEAFNSIEETTDILVPTIILLVGLITYIVFHELTHGLFYKIFTGEKLTYGFTLTVAYCGVPKLYVKRIPMVVTTLAPFVVFSIIFLAPLIFISNPLYIIVFGALFAVHAGGCIGDIYDAILLIFKYNDSSTIVNDTGPKQTIYSRH